ncbi:MAG: PAS domain-containing protein [Candidatus Firestonebacteria bacterium]|nr:PAS domain-containing protein [Candidatus Firestonebacteria bacterium]
MHKNINSEKKIAIIISVFSTIILLILYTLNAYKERLNILDENKKKGRILATQVVLTLAAEAQSDSSITKPAILSNNVNNINSTKGLYVFKIFNKLKPDKLSEFERQSFLHFEEGDDEAYKSIENHFEYIAPIYVIQACIRCHAKQKEGNILGAVKISFPSIDPNKWLISNVIKGLLLILINLLFFYFVIKFLWKFNIADIVKNEENNYHDEISKIKKTQSDESLELNQTISEQEKNITEQNKTIADLQKDNDIKKQEITKLKNDDILTLSKLRDTKADLLFQKRLLQIIFLNVQDGIYVLDKNGKVNVWNSSMEKITGYTKDDMFGKEINEDIFAYEDQYGNKIKKDFYPLTWVLQKGEFVSSPIKLRKRDGKIVMLSLKALPVKDNENKILGGIVILSDNLTQKEISPVSETPSIKIKETKIDNADIKNIVRSLWDYIEIMRDGDTGDLNETQMDFLDEIYYVLKQFKK